jgi:murein DD-endopeptidase MepM/ murein hydrolase activator NlpD
MRTRSIFAIALVLLLASAPASSTATTSHERPAPVGAWTWPLSTFRLERVFEAPAHRFGPGHRGIDLRADVEPPGVIAVLAPDAGAVAFSGLVAGRGILTIDHGAGLVTTLEPVDSELRPGERVIAGQTVGLLALGGHAPPGALHFGVRLHGEYINPLLLLGDVPRAVLLPCC